MKYNSFAEFWRQLPPGDKTHPADKPFLDEVNHSLMFENLPAFGAGPLATADVVLCYLNNRPLSKLGAFDRRLIIKQEKELKETWGEYLAGVIEGNRKIKPRPLTEWAKIRTRDFSPKLKAATFNIVPYRSPRFTNDDKRLTRVLPSAQMARNYLHDVLLPAAARGERFIVIGWGVKLWGVPKTQAHKTLHVQLPIGGYPGKDLSDRINVWWDNR
jgi:hypothetical protein